MDQVDLVETIYEAPFAPHLWTDILQSLSAIAGARGGVLTSFPVTPNIFLFNDSVADIIHDVASDRDQATAPMEDRFLALPAHAYHSDSDVYSEAEKEELVTYRKFFRPHGIGNIIANRVETPFGQTLMFAFMRDAAKGSVAGADLERLTALRPHIARAITLTTRNEFQQIRSTNQALGAAGLATAAISADGRVIDCNDRFAALTDQVRIGRFNKLRLTHDRANAILEECLAIAAGGREGISGAGRSFALPPVADAVPAILHVIPSGHLIRELFTGTALFVIIAPIGQIRPAPLDIIESLFDLTVSEAKIAQSLATGEDVRDIAEKFEISTETVRRHLKNIYSKTGISRQAELSAAIARMRLIE